MKEFNPDDYKEDFGWRNAPPKESPKQGYFSAKFKKGRRWNDFWPYSTMGELLFKKSPDGWGYFQINSDLQEKTRWDWWRNYLLWRITRILGL